MDQNSQQALANNSTPAFDGMPESPLPPHHKKVGPIVAILVLVLVMVMAGLYFFASQLNNAQTPTTDASNNASANQIVFQQNVQPAENTAVVSPSVTPITNTDNDPQSLANDLNAATNSLGSQSF